MSIPTELQHGLTLPLIVAPMFLVSDARLVIESCKNGAIGTLPALNLRTTEEFDACLSQIERELAAYTAASARPAAAYGVNLVVHRSNPRLQADLDVCIRHRAPLVITSLGAMEEVVAAVHAYGGIVFHDVVSRRHAEKAAAAGVDGLIAVCAGAGGHAGTLNPFALVAEIRSFFSKTVLLAGCINHGWDIAAALQMGADMAYMGTRFIAVEESPAAPAYKQMLIDSRAEDIVHTPAVSGVPANFMRASLEQAGYDMQALHTPGSIDYGNKLKPSADGASPWKTVWSAGQGCGEIRRSQTMQQLVEQLKTELRAATALQQAKVAAYL